MSGDIKPKQVSTVEDHDCSYVVIATSPKSVNKSICYWTGQSPRVLTADEALDIKTELDRAKEDKSESKYEIYKLVHVSRL